jgi:hypothetical protein
MKKYESFEDFIDQLASTEEGESIPDEKIMEALNSVDWGAQMDTFKNEPGTELDMTLERFKKMMQN